MSGFKERVHELKDRFTHPHHSKPDSSSSVHHQDTVTEAERQDEGPLAAGVNSIEKMSEIKGAAPEVQLLPNDTRIDLSPHLQRRLQEDRDQFGSTHPRLDGLKRDGVIDGGNGNASAAGGAANPANASSLEPQQPQHLHVHTQANSRSFSAADMEEHEARRQAHLAAKSQAAGTEVLEAKKKAEEHNDGAGSSSGRDAPEEGGILDSVMKAVGAKPSGALASSLSELDEINKKLEETKARERELEAKAAQIKGKP